MQTPQNTQNDKRQEREETLTPRALYIALGRNNRPAMIEAGSGYPATFGKFIDEYRTYAGMASNDLMLHYRLPEGMRIPDWKPYWNGQDFGDYLHALLPRLHERGICPVHQIRVYDALYCRHKYLDQEAPENTRAWLMLRDDYHAFMGRRLIPYMADNRDLHRGVVTDRGILLFRMDPEGQRERYRYLSHVAGNFFHPQTPGGTLHLTEAVPLEGARIPLPRLPEHIWGQYIDPGQSLPQIDRPYYADPSCLIAQQATDSYDMAPTGRNLLALCDPDRGIEIMPARKSIDIALLDCLQREAALPENAETFLRYHFGFRKPFEELLGDLRALDPDSHRASELRAAISERAGALLEEHYPLRRREPEIEDEQALSREWTQNKGYTL